MNFSGYIFCKLESCKNLITKQIINTINTVVFVNSNKNFLLNNTKVLLLRQYQWYNTEN